MWPRGNSNSDSDCCKNNPRMPKSYVSNCFCYLPSATVTFVQDLLPLLISMRIEMSEKVYVGISSHKPSLRGSFSIILIFAFMAHTNFALMALQVFMERHKLQSSKQ